MPKAQKLQRSFSQLLGQATADGFISNGELKNVIQSFTNMEDTFRLSGKGTTKTERKILKFQGAKVQDAFRLYEQNRTSHTTETVEKRIPVEVIKEVVKEIEVEKIVEVQVEKIVKVPGPALETVEVIKEVKVPGPTQTVEVIRYQHIDRPVQVIEYRDAPSFTGVRDHITMSVDAATNEATVKIIDSPEDGTITADQDLIISWYKQRSDVPGNRELNNIIKKLDNGDYDSRQITGDKTTTLTIPLDAEDVKSIVDGGSDGYYAIWSEDTDKLDKYTDGLAVFLPLGAVPTTT